MRWVNTGYSISFWCRTAVVVDNAGILFFTMDTNADWVLVVYIVYHVAGMWKRLWIWQPFCPTCSYSQYIMKLGDQCESLHTDLPSHCWQPGLWLNLAVASFRNPLGCVVMIISAGVQQTSTWSSFPWKYGFCSDAFMDNWTLCWPCHQSCSLFHVLSKWAVPACCTPCLILAWVCCGTNLPARVMGSLPWIAVWRGDTMCFP